MTLPIDELVEKLGSERALIQHLGKRRPDVRIALEMTFAELEAAISALTSLQERNRKLEEALKPFAEIGKWLGRTPDSRTMSIIGLVVEADGLNSHGSHSLKSGAFLRARALLSGAGG